MKRGKTRQSGSFLKVRLTRLANRLDTDKWKHTLDVKEAAAERSKAPNPEVT